jgi:hypothetical protein
MGVIYAEEGKTARASLLWRELVHEAPDYEPALKNLGLLGNQVQLTRGETAAVAPSRRPPSKPSDTNADHICRHPKYGGNRRNQAEVKYHGRISSK